MTNFENTSNNITYMNYFDASTNGEINANTDSTSINLRNACITRWGAGSCVNALENSSRFYLYGFPNATQETKTSRAASSTNYRIAFLAPSMGGSVTTTGTIGRLNSNNATTTTVNLVSQNASINVSSGITNSYEYAIITNQNVTVSGFASNGASLNTATWRFVSSGWLFDSVFSGGSVFRSLYSLYFSNLGHSHAFRVSAEAQTTAQVMLTSGSAQYSITCASDTGNGTTPGADLWCTDLWLRDSPSGYAVGRIPHVLLAKGAGFTLGNLYYNPTVIDGVTDQKIWLCCANYGTDKLLMRVWTEGIS